MENIKKTYTPPTAELVVLTENVETALSGFNIESKNSDWLFS